jgi:hypothetical protein
MTSGIPLPRRNDALATSFVGGAGQKDWDAPVIAAMKAQLGG